MPLYQIKHLPALNTELNGVSDMSKLPVGNGKPPQEDPQVFLGAISLRPSFHTPSPHPPSNVSIPANQYHQEDTPFSSVVDIFHGFCLFDCFIFVDILFPRRDTLTNGPDASLDFIHLICDMTEGIRHPRFIWLNPTEYSINNPDSAHPWYAHVGQIKTYMAFDKHIREGKQISAFPGVPLGYTEFVNAYNGGTYPQDKQHLSEYTFTSDGDQVKPLDKPVLLRDFRITREQCGLAPPPPPMQTRVNGLIVNQFAELQALKNERQREGFRQREERRQSLFNEYRPQRGRGRARGNVSGPQRNFGKGKERRFNPVSAHYIDLTADDDP
jgi:hypothetical protein